MFNSILSIILKKKMNVLKKDIKNCIKEVDNEVRI